jgi:hypothetical protein
MLEILSSSQTLVSTIRACFTVRILSTWPIVLVILWSLSPAGGQGALRSFDLKENITTIEETYASYPSNNLSVYINGPWESVSGGQSLMNQFRLPINAAFSGQDIGLLQANAVRTNQFIEAQNRIGGPSEAARVTQRDIWRNVRIPILHSGGLYNRFCRLGQRATTGDPALFIAYRCTCPRFPSWHRRQCYLHG